jgi:hypothetical protein
MATTTAICSFQTLLYKDTSATHLSFLGICIIKKICYAGSKEKKM